MSNYILFTILFLLLSGLFFLFKPKNCIKNGLPLWVAMAILLLCPLSACSSISDHAESSSQAETIQESTAVETTAIVETELPVSSTEITNEIVTNPMEETPTAIVPENSSFSIHFIDVGQADSALVECDGHYMLIDGGNKEDSSLIYSVLKKDNIKNLDIIVGTHAHEDHIGGLPGALNYATADITLCPVTNYDSNAFSDFATYSEKNGGGITVPSVGDIYQLGSASVHILGVNGGIDTNNTSIVLKIVYGQTSFLFTGDAEREAEQAILASGADLSATVLKVGHHGSDTSTTYPFLREIMPKYGIISVGKDNSYGHPTDDTLSRLRDADVEIFRTDLQGDIFCTSDGNTVTITTERSATSEELMKSGAIVTSTNTPESIEETTAAPSTTSATVDYILNTNTKKFHYPTCKSVKQMKEKNKKSFTGTREEVIAMGYDPCGNCHP